MHATMIVPFFTLLMCIICASSADAMKLVYFDARGVVELTRVMFKLGSIPFEDARFELKVKEGGGFETPGFTTAKATGELAANMDRAPILVIGDTKIGQSKAIERFVAKKANFFGDNELEAAQIDCLSEHVRDIKDKWQKIKATGGMAPSPEKDVAMKKFIEEGELKEWFVKLEKSLPTSAANVYSVGQRLSYADLCIWQLLKDFFDAPNAEKVAKCLSESGCTKLVKIADNVAENPALKQWLETRPKTMF